MKKIGILTWHYYNNYGSSLQAYALQYFLENVGFEVEIINYRNPKKAEPRYRIALKGTIGRMLHFLGVKTINSVEFQLFHNDFLRETKRLDNADEVHNVSLKYDYIVCGSDQIWAPNVYNPIYMFNFKTPAKKIAYAASIGLRRIPETLIEEYRINLLDFYKIMVREDSAKLILKEQVGVESITVLDPTLLLDVSVYEKIANIPKDTGMCFVYILNKNHNYKEKILRFAEIHGLKIIGYSANKADYSWIKQAKACGPREFLGYVKKAEFILTDSYHGTIFSMLFHKPFFTFERFLPGDPLNQNSRIDQLKKLFNISDFIISAGEELPTRFSYDFNEFEKKLLNERERIIHIWSEMK